MNIRMTKAEALARQAKQIEHYSPHHPHCASIVAAATTADVLEDGVEYDILTINKHIPRGRQIEAMLGIPDQGGN